MRRLAVPIALTVCVILYAADGESARAPARAPLDRAPDVPRPGEPEADGLAPQAAETLEGKAETPVPIQGVVLDPDGGPIAGATVLVKFGHVARGRCRFPLGICDGEARATTDGGGIFTLDAPASARWAVVNVDADGWAEPAPRVASFGSGTVVIRVPRGEAWHRVAGPPLPGDCDGIPADARAMGLLAGEAWPRIRIVLERSERIEGTVLTGAGAPVPGAAVTARWQDGLPGWRTLEASADACGRFSMRVPAVALITAAPVETVGGRVLAKDVQAWAWPVQPGTSDLRLVLAGQVALDLDVCKPRSRWTSPGSAQRPWASLVRATGSSAWVGST